MKIFGRWICWIVSLLAVTTCDVVLTPQGRMNPEDGNTLTGGGDPTEDQEHVRAHLLGYG